ncbi:NUDIX hydrolase domain-like protein [Hysterangium stoloniferum]|nr:NUDIX hydrolase domain-like protein [Hysterangium stoloniferum]
MPPKHFTPTLSGDSTGAVPDSLFFCRDFLLGAGTVIIQPSTGKVVLIYSPTLGIWFLPKGRKDIGESVEQAALREAYEEAGYRVQFLPLPIPTRAPKGKISPQPSKESVPIQQRFNTEPIYITAECYLKGPKKIATEYFTFWYVTFIGPDAVQEENTRMANEQDYETSLMSVEEALGKLKYSRQVEVVRKAYQLWVETEKNFKDLKLEGTP